MTARIHGRGRNMGRADRRWALLALLPLAYFLGQLVRGVIVHGGLPW